MSVQAEFEHRARHFRIEGVAVDDHIFKKIESTGSFYELDLLEYMQQLREFIRTPERMNVVLDVGANIGNHSVYFGAFIADQLIAVEPNPGVLTQLRHNLAANLDNYTLVETAVGETEGRGAIAVPAKGEDNIGAAMIDATATEGEIAITTLDAVLTEWQQQHTEPFKVALIKIDIEGMELPALKGARQLISTHRPHIFAEAGDAAALDSIAGYLATLGYERLPGHWAGTPVYHFAYRPAAALRLKTLSLRLRRTFTRLGRSISKRL